MVFTPTISGVPSEVVTYSTHKEKANLPTDVENVAKSPSEVANIAIHAILGPNVHLVKYGDLDSYFLGVLNTNIKTDEVRVEAAKQLVTIHGVKIKLVCDCLGVNQEAIIGKSKNQLES